MFSIFHGLFSLFAIIANDINKQRQDNINKTYAQQHNNLTYYSTKGDRLVSNGRLVYTTYNDKGHKVLKDLYNGRVYCDLTANKTQEQRKENKEQAKRLGHDIYICTSDKRYAIGAERLHTVEFDVDTDEPVKFIKINNIGFYMSYKTGLITRVNKSYRDCVGKQTYIYENFICPIEPEDIMRIFNERQIILQNNKSFKKDSWWMEKVYYLDSHYSNNLYMDNIGRISDMIYPDIMELRNEGLPKLIRLTKCNNTEYDKIMRRLNHECKR